MHTISIAESNGKYRFECSCGIVGNWYGNKDVAASTGSGHKQQADGNPDQQPGGSDDPHTGW
jgi:hypothetical protein